MNSPLKVLQIVPSISLIYGGPSQMVRGLSGGLARQGATVTVITTDSNGDIDQPPLEVPLNQPVAQDGYEVIYFRCSPFRRYKFSLGLLNWLRQHAHQYDIAHIHALFSPVSTASATVARWQGLPYIMRPLGTLDPADLQKKKQFKQVYVSLFERSNLKGAAAIHFTSPQEAKVSERFGLTTPDLVMPLGVRLPEFQQSEAAAARSIREQFKIAAGVPIVLFMSRVDPKKGLDLLLPALTQLQQSGVPFHFVLSGSNPQDRAYERAIATQIQTLPLNHCTTLTGFVSGALKAQLLQAADVFVLPSYYENFGIAVAEAMMASKPVVISDQVHIWPNIQSSESGWVVPCEVAPLQAALQQALTNADERQRRGENGQHYATENYGWDAIAQRMIQAYRDLLTQH
ncbi:MAG: hormogonium polysaccharide biosynthesis glycosyltransferase HpsP [Cyanobacteria bacterium P01_A01_bin.114]